MALLETTTPSNQPHSSRGQMEGDQSGRRTFDMKITNKSPRDDDTTRLEIRQGTWPELIDHWRRLGPPIDDSKIYTFVMQSVPVNYCHDDRLSLPRKSLTHNSNVNRTPTRAFIGVFLSRSLSAPRSLRLDVRHTSSGALGNTSPQPAR